MIFNTIFNDWYNNNFLKNNNIINDQFDCDIIMNINLYELFIRVGFLAYTYNDNLTYNTISSLYNHKVIMDFIDKEHMTFLMYYFNPDIGIFSLDYRDFLHKHKVYLIRNSTCTKAKLEKALLLFYEYGYNLADKYYNINLY